LHHRVGENLVHHLENAKHHREASIGERIRRECSKSCKSSGCIIFSIDARLASLQISSPP